MQIFKFVSTIDYVVALMLPFRKDLINDCSKGLILVFYYFQSIDVNAKMVKNFGQQSINKCCHFYKMIDYRLYSYLSHRSNGTLDYFI